MSSEKSQAGTEPDRHHDPEAGGFGSSQRRVVTELVVLLLALILLPVGVVYGAGRFAALLLPWVPLSVDRALGKQAELSMSLGQDTCDSPGLAPYLTQLTAPLVDAAGGAFRFEFRVVADQAVNAYALPGGYVTVNFGLLEQASSSEEVAAVLAHELQHVLQRHSTARLLTSLGGSVVLAGLFGGTDLSAPAAVVRSVLQSSYSRQQEAEADRLGLDLLTKAGIDPSGMATFFERLSQLEQAPPEILSTHPDPGNRAANARAAAQGRTPSRPLPPLPRVACH